MRKTTPFVLLLACATAQASDWVSIGKHDGGEDFLDVSSILVAGDIRRAWIKSVFPQHSVKGDGQNAKKWVSYGLIRPAYNCKEGTTRIEAALAYFTDGTNDSEPPAFISVIWKPVPPDTVEHTFMEQVCAWKPK